MRRALIVLSLMVCLPPVSSFAATYYVAKTGNNAYSCTQAQSQSTPKRTIQAGVNCAKAAGDTVIIKAGTYTESVIVGASGARGNPITLKANPGDTVVWTNSNTSPTGGWGDAALNIVDRSYIRIEGFTFRGTRTQVTVFILNGTFNKTSTPVQGIEIVNNVFDDNGHNGEPNGDSSAVIYMASIGRDTSYTGATVNSVTGNTFTNNYGLNINLFGTSDTRVSNNIGTGMKGSSNQFNGFLYGAMYVFFGTDGPNNTYAERNIIENNNFGSADSSRTTDVELTGVRCDVGGRNSIIRNNTLHDILYGATWNSTQHTYGILLEASCNNNTVQNNIIYRISMACITLGYSGVSITEGNTVDGNVGYQCDKVGLFLDHAKNTTVKNNIFMNNGARGGSQVQVSRASVSNGGHTFHHNDYFTTAGSYIGVWDHNWWDAYVWFPDANLTLSQWNSASGETNSLSTNPLFVSPPSSFYLQSGSPARLAGEKGIDMGAYPAADFTSLPPPTNLRIVP